MSTPHSSVVAFDLGYVVVEVVDRQVGFLSQKDAERIPLGTSPRPVPGRRADVALRVEVCGLGCR